MLNKKAPEGAGYEIEWALLCDRVTENDVDGLDFFGVCHRFHMLKNQPARKCLVIKMRGVGVDVQRGSILHVGDLSITIFNSTGNALESLTKDVAWQHGFYVKTIQVPRTEVGDYTVQILDDLVLMHSFHYSVLDPADQSKLF